MTQAERRIYLIKYLLNENPQYSGAVIPQNEAEQKRLLRGLFNVRMPKPISTEFLEIQNDYLCEETARKGVTDYKDLSPVQKGIYLWQGDITALKCDGIVNAANSGMLGCFCPNHACIDNAIHTYAGVELRLYCNEIMEKQGFPEPTGQAKITPAFNLPCKYVLHTVGPIIDGEPTAEDCGLLRLCYLSCLKEAVKNGLSSIAFCCISTGEFHFPNELAAQIAIEAVKSFIEETKSEIEVIFNVFKEIDYRIYRKLL